jgi:putative heme-binding domain-containing protein
VGKKLTRVQVLDRLLYPSKNMDPKYVPYLIELKDGRTHTGLVAEKTADHLLLRTAQDAQVRIPAADVAELTALKTSLMPEQQLRDLSAEQAADLLAYLDSLR